MKSDHLSTTSAYRPSFSPRRGVFISVYVLDVVVQFRSVPCGCRVWSNLSLDPLWPELAPRNT